MKVLLIHEHGRAFGSGAVTAMYRLHAGLRARHIDSTIACRKPALDGPDVIELPRSDRIESILGTISWRLGLNDVHCVSTFKLTKFKPFLDADVVNGHGLHTNFFNYLALPRLARRKPLIITMHDMWALTGHCSQSYDCERWKTGCGRCPYPETFPPIGRDGTAIEWKLKNRTYRKSNMTFVAPSRWLLDIARQSMLKNYDLRQIPNPVDHEIYKPLNRDASRRQLGLPLDKHIIMFISVALHDRAKGGDLLVRALASLPPRLKENAVLLLMGERADEFARASGMTSIALGYIHDDQKKAIIYSAADVSVQPSRAENQSLVVMESLACGTPVVAFDVGGNAEMVQMGPGGVIAPPEDVEAFGSGIARILENSAMRDSLSNSARRSVIENYTLDLHCARYIALYEEKISQWREAEAHA